MTSQPENKNTSNMEGMEKTLLENLLLETLKEQRRKRRWGIFFKIIGIFLIIPLVTLIATLDFSGTEATPPGKHTALIRIEGVIDAGGRASADNVNKALNKAFAEKNATGVILRINSPGGSPVQAGIIYDEILRLRLANPDKPIHVVVEEICASGGYYVASAVENIYVNKASLVGSIGVLVNGFGFTGLMDKMGVERRLITSGKNKGFMDPFSPQNPEQKAHIQKLIDEIHQQFITVVKNGRGKRLQEKEDTFTGLIWTGVDAVKLGLADDFGTVDTISQNVFGNQEVVDYTESDKISDRLLKRFGASAGYGAMQFLQEAGLLNKLQLQ